MSTHDFTASFHVADTPPTVFRTIMNVRGWWSGLFGEEIQDDDEGFTFRAGGGMHYSRQQLSEIVPDKKVVWTVTDSKLTFLKEQDEWNGTKIGFELSPEAGGTRITFTHSGLTPALECYDQCSNAWGRYLQERLMSLLNKLPQNSSLSHE